jgi:UDP-N-acetylglucosamine diphosphorylase / glucose-1-phosphate thymidylyltransferase / UDP-N-acetylgalactosamine diphosphorylase / glucosamine-1-phosphate N-acetyltransferase / galactosamine-1-phosphate N-acetyltransferase
MIHPADFFDLSKSQHKDLFEGIELVWDVLKRLPSYVDAQLQPGIQGRVHSMAYVEENVYIGPGTVVEAGAVIKGPTIIGANCEVRAGAYIRGSVLAGDGVVIGHATELKTCFLSDGVEVPHLAYVGDSMLGWRAHLGAGVKLSNFKINHMPVTVTIEGKQYNTGLLKFGAVLGDEVEIGCNSVINPGGLIGKRTLAYSNLSLHGYYPPDSVIKLHQSIEIIARKYNS